jgi:hypothetical protein
MTEHDNDEALDAAIEHILSGSPQVPPSNPDTDSLTLIAAHLYGMPSPDFRSRLAAELFGQRTHRVWWLSLRRASALRRAAPLALAAGAITAAAIALALVNPFTGSGGVSAPAEAFGALPIPPDTVVPEASGDSGTITYELSPNVSLPDTALAYRLRLPEISDARVRQVGDALGLTQPVQQQWNPDGTPAGYSVASVEGCPPAGAKLLLGCDTGTVFSMTLAGVFWFQDSAVSDGATPPDPTRALGAAQDWLTRAGLTNSDAFSLSISKAPVKIDPAAGAEATLPPRRFVEVIADPTALSDQPSEGPQISMTIDSDGKVVRASGFWATPDAKSPYTLHNVDQLRDDLQALRGNFSKLDGSGGFENADKAQPATATVQGVALTYSRADPANGARGETYLVPVYSVKVMLTQNGKTVGGFATSVPATGWPDQAP